MDDPVTRPRVSVIMPVYCSSDEHETYLREALESIAKQTFRDFEVILVDDVSPRDIHPILEKVGELPGLRLIRNEENLKHARSRNVGILAANADIIAFLDHDDTWDERKLATDVIELSENPDVAMVFCAVSTFGPEACRLKINQAIIPRSPSYPWLFRHSNYVVTASAATVRRDVMIEIGLFDPRYTTTDDFDAWLKITHRYPILYHPEKLINYRLHDCNTNYTVDPINDNRLIMSLAWGYWKAAPLGEKLVLLPKFIRKVLGRFYMAIKLRRHFFG